MVRIEHEEIMKTRMENCKHMLAKVLRSLGVELKVLGSTTDFRSLRLRMVTLNKESTMGHHSVSARSIRRKF